MKTNKSTGRFDNRILFLCLAVLILAIAIDVVVQGKTPDAGVLNESAQVVETGSPVQIIKASDWQSKYPDEYASYMRNEENSEVVDYVAEYPSWWRIWPLCRCRTSAFPC